MRLTKLDDVGIFFHGVSLLWEVPAGLNTRLDTPPSQAASPIFGHSPTTDDPDLADYYASRVILGSEAFVMTVADYTTFADAMKRKLLREIGEPSVPLLSSLSEGSASTNVTFD